MGIIKICLCSNTLEEITLGKIQELNSSISSSKECLESSSFRDKLNKGSNRNRGSRVCNMVDQFHKVKRKDTKMMKKLTITKQIKMYTYSTKEETMISINLPQL